MEQRAHARPPTELLGRLRWFFLLFALFFTVTYLPALTVESGRPWWWRAAATALLVSLWVWWWRCYRRDRFPGLGLLLEVAAFTACVLTPADPFRALGLLYIAVNFRSLYGSARSVAAYTALAVLSFVAGVVLAPWTGLPDRSALLAYTIPGVPVLAVITHLVARASDRLARAAARERLLSRTGLAMARADVVGDVVDQARSGLAELVADVAEVRARLRSAAPDDVLGGSDVALVDRLGPAGVPVVVEIPLHAPVGVVATLVVETRAALPVEIRDALSVLTAQAALALANAALTRDLHRRACEDPLTRLANRAALEAEVSAAVSRGPCAVMVLDLDGFKQVNDTRGHAAGDALLVEVADRLRRTADEGDLVARLGGDEFVVLARRGVDAVGASALGRRLLEAVSAPVSLADGPAHVGVSIGVALSAPGDDAAAVLLAADRAMYEAKQAGRSRVRLSAERGPLPRPVGLGGAVATPPAQRGRDDAPAVGQGVG